MADDSDDEGLFDGLFGGGGEEEEERDEEVKMVTDSYSRKRPGADPSEITMYLIASQHSLWGNKLWNASIVLADIYDELSYVCKGKHFLELGAGAGLPGLICALNGAERVVITDYGTECDYSLVEVIQQNVDILASRYPTGTKVEALPFIWGQDVQPLLSPPSVEPAAFADSNSNTDAAVDSGRKFDVLILADLLFNRSEHSKLLKSCKELMAEDGTAWVTYSHHDPEKAALDRNFFKLAIEEPFNFVVTKVRSQQLVDLFVCNDGMDKARGVVYLYHLQNGGAPDQMLDLFPPPDLGHLDVGPS